MLGLLAHYRPPSNVAVCMWAQYDLWVRIFNSDSTDFSNRERRTARLDGAWVFSGGDVVGANKRSSY